LICREFIRSAKYRAQIRCDRLLHNAAKSGTFARFCDLRHAFFSLRNVKLRRDKRGEMIMVDMVTRWGNSALMITFLLITYAVLITLR
jgi:hypothetical protein